MKGNMRHLVLCVCIASVVLAAFAGAGVSVASATAWHVGDDLADYPDANFTSIQDAMDAASDSDDDCV